MIKLPDYINLTWKIAPYRWSQPGPASQPTQDTDCDIPHPLKRQGTTQAERQLPALLDPAYFQFDERTLNDLLVQSGNFARHIVYIDPTLLPPAANGDWTPFFSDFLNKISDPANPLHSYFNQTNDNYITLSTGQNLPAHMALFVTFLSLFGYAQNDLNNVLERYIRFYYRRVLQLTEQGPVPDQLCAVFTPNKNAAETLVPAGTPLKAGNDSSGLPLIYQTNEDLIVNQGVVNSLKAFYCDKNNKFYAAQAINMADYISKPITTTPPAWPTFGNATSPSTLPPGVNTIPSASLGFILSSPVFMLPEASRVITLTFAWGDPSFNLSNAVETNAIEVKYSTVKGWNTLSASAITSVTSSPYITLGANSITITLDPPDPGVAGYVEATHQLNLDSPLGYPVFQFLFSSDPNDIRGVTFSSVQIGVAVTGAQNLTLQNDDGAIDPSKPFMPYTNKPIANSSNFYIGYPLAFNKYLSQFSVDFKWVNQPSASGSNFTNYYSGYNFSAATLTDMDTDSGTLMGSPSVLSNGGWSSVSQAQNSGTVSAIIILTQFEMPQYNYNEKYNGNVEYFRDYLTQTFTVGGMFTNGVDPQTPQPAKPYTLNTLNGFVRFTNNYDYGQSQYSMLLTTAVLNALPTSTSTTTNTTTVNPANNPASTTTSDGSISASVTDGSITASSTTTTSSPPKPNYPNAPYIPTLTILDIDYNLSANFGGNGSDLTTQMYYIQPFGTQSVLIPGGSASIPLLPPGYNVNGALYIGISNLKALDSVSLYFDMWDGSGNNTVDIEQATLTWQYLSTVGGFTPLNPPNSSNTFYVVEDATNGMTGSGIVRINIPYDAADASTASSIMPAGMVWLCVSVGANASDLVSGFSMMINIVAQAVEATFVNNGNAPDHLQYPLPPNTVTGFASGVQGIKSVSQPFASTDGAMAEAKDAFYVRVSERLRHKQRSWSIWDYEHMVLQAFPSIYEAKCISHTNSSIEYAPGYVKVVVIPVIVNMPNQNPQQPMVGQAVIADITTYLQQYMSPWVAQNLLVANPSYETLQVTAYVQLNPEYADFNYYQQVLQNDIISFICPWNADSESGLLFDNVLYTSQLMNFVAERPYVQYITQFSVTKTDYQGNVTTCGEEITCSNESCILTSASSHIISPGTC